MKLPKFYKTIKDEPIFQEWEQRLKEIHAIEDTVARLLSYRELELAVQIYKSKSIKRASFLGTISIIGGAAFALPASIAIETVLPFLGTVAAYALFTTMEPRLSIKYHQPQGDLLTRIKETMSTLTLDTPIEKLAASPRFEEAVKKFPELKAQFAEAALKDGYNPANYAVVQLPKAPSGFKLRQ